MDFERKFNIDTKKSQTHATQFDMVIYAYSWSFGR